MTHASPPKERPWRRRRLDDAWRTALAAGAVAVLAVVALAVLALVLRAGRGESTPPLHTLVIGQSQDFATLDPALASSEAAWQLEYSTCAKLLDYPDRTGYPGTRLAPEVATALPRLSRDRLTYTLSVRRGWRFSDGEPVTARSFARSFARARSPELVSPAAAYLQDVLWWRVRGRVLTIRLRRAAPDFAQRLALPYFCAVPSWAPDVQSDALPSAGPLYVAHYTRGNALLLRRNPYYRGPRHVRVRAVQYVFGAYASQIVLEIERGEIDYGVPTAGSSASIAAAAGLAKRMHVFTFQEPLVAYLALNTQRPLFRDNPSLRRAVSYALDRPELAGLFGPNGATPNDEYLPPGFPGYRAQHLYPLQGPDLATARRLAQGHLRGAHAVFYACASLDCQERAIVVADSLRRIGLHVSIQSGGIGNLAGVRGTHFDIADVITRPDYGDPYALIDKLLDGRVIRSVANTNLSYFADPRFNRSIDAAQRLEGLPRDRAYGQLGLAVAHTEAPLAAYAVLNARVVVSNRVGCLTYQAVYGVDLAGLCLRPA